MNNIIIGQNISKQKLELAKQLRKNMTPAEKLLWQHLRNNRLNGLKFRRQQIIDGFIVDFYCHFAQLVVEVDGEIHQQQIEYDRERDEVLKKRGLRLLRLKNEDVINNIEGVLQMILACCLS